MSLGSIDPKHPAMAKKESQNPLPSGAAGLKTIRDGGECNIGYETGNLNTLMDKVLDDAKGCSEEESEKLEELLRDSLAKGVVVAMRMEEYCENHSSRRVSITFERHPELLEVHQEIGRLQAEAEETRKKMQELLAAGKEALQKRWELAVKLGGLSPENNYYMINEEAGCVELVELNCHECKGAVKVRKARQALQEYAAKIKP
jgi:hypothetical protein